MKNESPEEISEEEEFHLALGVFLDDLEALSQTPEKACEMEGFFNVAYEFWYLVPNDYLLENPLGLLSDSQLSALNRLFVCIRGLPEEAISWTTAAEESLENMSHPEWEPIRQQAKELMELLEPIKEVNRKYFYHREH